MLDVGCISHVYHVIMVDSCHISFLSVAIKAAVDAATGQLSTLPPETPMEDEFTAVYKATTTGLPTLVC